MQTQLWCERKEDLGLLLGDFGAVAGPQGLEAPEAAEASQLHLKGASCDDHGDYSIMMIFAYYESQL